MMIYTEEDMFKKSFAAAIGLEEPLFLCQKIFKTLKNIKLQMINLLESYQEVCLSKR